MSPCRAVRVADATTSSGIIILTYMCGNVSSALYSRRETGYLLGETMAGGIKELIINDRSARSAADVSVRNRRELTDECRGQEDESDRDLVEAAQFTATGGEREHDQCPDGQDEGEGIHAVLP